MKLEKLNPTTTAGSLTRQLSGTGMVKATVWAAYLLFMTVATAFGQGDQSAQQLMSSGNNGSAARVSSMATGQVLLDRNASQPFDSSSRLKLLPPNAPAKSTGVRKISSNVLLETLPNAAAPSEKPVYSTGSPYQLREVPAEAKSSRVEPLKVTPVSSGLSAVVDPQTENLANAPKVSRIPLPNRPSSSNPTAIPKSLNTPTEPAPSLMALPEQPLALPMTGSVGEVPSLDRVDDGLLPDLPQSNTGESVSVPTLLPPTSAAELPVLGSLPSLETDNQQLGTQASLPSLPAPQLPAASLPSAAMPAPLSTNALSLPKLDVSSSNSVPNSSANAAYSPSASTQATESATERLKMQSPRLAVSLVGPRDLAVGAPTNYRLNVRNEDRIKLDGIIVRLDLPPGVAVQPAQASHGSAELERAQDGTTMLTWSFENLDGNQEANLPLRVLADQPRSFNVAMEWTLLPMSGHAAVNVLTPLLELALEGPKEVNFSEPNTYRLHVRNRGNADANDVAIKLSAEQFGSSATEIGKIAAGAQQTIDVELVFNEAGTIVIAAEANATGNVAAASQVSVQVLQAKLDAVLEAPQLVYHSSPTSYLLRIQNSGNAVAKNARALITLPLDCTAVSLPPSAKLEGNTIVCELDQLRPGQTSETAFNLSFGREGDNQVSVQCTSSSSSPIQCAASTMVKAVSDLKLFVTDPVAPAPVDGEVTYELTLVNRGSKAAEEVNVVAMFSKDIEPTRAEGHRSQLMTGQVRFESIPRVEPGQSITLRVFAKASTAGMHRFRAEVRTAEADVKLVQEQSTEYMEAIRRTASVPGTTIR